MHSQTPMLNPISSGSPIPGASGTSVVPSSDREQVQYAIEFGGALEDLTAYYYELQRLRGQQEATLQMPESEKEPKFPPDLLVELTAEGLLDRTWKKLLKLEPKLLGDEQLNETQQQGSNSTHLLWRSDIQKKIAEIQKGMPGPQRNERFDHMICVFNQHIVGLLLDSPMVLSGYRVGKALRYTYWLIKGIPSDDEKTSYANVNSASNRWDEAFSKKRLEEMQAHVNALATVLDSQAVTAVATSLGYWRATLLCFTRSEGFLSTWLHLWRRKNAPSSLDIEISERTSKEFLTVLEKQVTNWKDVLTGRRDLKSFPIPGTVPALTTKMAASPWARLVRFSVPLIAGIAAVVIVGALIAVAIMVYQITMTSEGTTTSETWIPGVGTAVVGVFTSVFTFLSIQGRSLFGWGAGAMNQVKQQADDLLEISNDDRNETISRGIGLVKHGARAFEASLIDLKQRALSNVIRQIWQEDLNLAISDPLISCVLNLKEKKKDDPRKNVEYFLRLVYGKESNLHRLQPLFKQLYKHYRPMQPS